MLSSLLFTAIFALTLYRMFRPTRPGERILLLGLFLLTLLTVTTHPWIAKSYGWLPLLEQSALATLVLWLAANPVFAWRKRWEKEKGGFLLLRNGRGPLSEIIAASQRLAQNRKGALIAIEKKVPLEEWTHSGVPLDGKIRRETIFSVFTSPGALHDGGMVIRGERIAACGVVFPLSKRLDLPTELGTRHRAALGLSEVTDALILVVSEETGKISLADQGTLLYDVQPDGLEEVVEKGLRGKLVRPPSSRRRLRGRQDNLRARMALPSGRQVSASA